jgi:hypothetical protein
MRMKRKCSIKAGNKRAKKFYSFLIIMIGACAVLLTPLMQAAVTAADKGTSRPIAVISGTLLVYEGHRVYLNGTLSSDPAGNALNYRWKLTYSPEGSTAVISAGSDPHASFAPDKTGVYQVQLIVNNGFVDSEPAYATITVIRQPYVW